MPDNPFANLGNLLGDLPDGPDHVPSPTDDATDADAAAAERKRMPLRLHLDRKQRRGKTATIITGWTGEDDDALAALGKRLKVACGVGGNTKNGEIILQGDHREKVLKLLREAGYANAKKSGG